MKANKSIQYDNASQRLKASAYIYNIGVKEAKVRILESIKKKYADMHNDGRIHIHDIETYKYTYNCLQVDVLKNFPFDKFTKYNEQRKIIEIVNHYRNLVDRLGHEQSGGIGFPNIDDEISILFEKMGIKDSPENLEALRLVIESFMDWLNETHERNCQYSFYVTFNLGLSTTKIGRFVTRSILEYFKSTSLDVIKPNIIFKVKKGINYCTTDLNYDMFCMSVESTCKKMIPTYLLFDSEPNKTYDPYLVAIMGCRTKVVSNLYGEPRSIGRANIAYTSINLPRIALEVDNDYPTDSVDEKLNRFKAIWNETAFIVRDILLDRYHRLLELTPKDFPCNSQYSLWTQDFKSAKSLEEIFRHGSFSIGFIGLSEAVEVLTGNKFYSSEETHHLATEIVRYMREVVDAFKNDCQLNFTLLATSGEMISGRFPTEDKKLFDHKILEKGYYTNSFHVDVDADMNPIKKIEIEGPFHSYCNGGSISYVEFSSAPLHNVEAVKAVIEAGIDNGVNYLGINFPLDECRNCHEIGTFDICPKCGGKDIYRVRRVSGYLEDLDYFTAGKRAEERRRRPNMLIDDAMGED